MPAREFTRSSFIEERVLGRGGIRLIIVTRLGLCLKVLK